MRTCILSMQLPDRVPTREDKTTFATYNCTYVPMWHQIAAPVEAPDNYSFQRQWTSVLGETRLAMDNADMEMVEGRA